MDMKDLLQRGLKLRREIFGDTAVTKRMQAVGEFGAPLQDLINGYAYGDVWSRPDLSKKMRSLAVLGMTAAINRPHEFRVHMHGALRNGCSRDEIREVLLMVALYCGIPASNDAHRIALEVFEERDQGR